MRVVFLALPVSMFAANLIQPSGWTSWSPRPEIAPKFAKSTEVLSIASRRFADYGKWKSARLTITPGAYYRCNLQYLPRNVAHEEVSVAAMITWIGRDGSREIQRDYVDRKPPASGEWRQLTRTIQAPASATGAVIELIFRWSQGGAVQFRQPEFAQTDAPAPRPVKIATTHFRPKGPATFESNLSAMTALIEQAGKQHADIICLSEDLVERAVDLPLEQRAHPVPGPITVKLGEAARRNNIWVVTAIVEREGDVIYNTAVLLDRQGRLAAKYRKVHLPTAEAEDGMTPGSDYQVFDTDFGRVGLSVCWDNWFPETARILRLKGAEILLFPLAGDADNHWDLISRARAVDNGLYIVSSNTTGGNSRVIDPSGAVLAEATPQSGFATAVIDLNREWRTPWLSIGPGLGEAKSLYMLERRPDTYSGITNNENKSKNQRKVND